MITSVISNTAKEIFNLKYSVQLSEKSFFPIKTKSEFDGDYTLVMFPLLSFSKNTPQELAKFLGDELKNKLDFITDYQIIKGFLNLKISGKYWIKYNIEFDENSCKIQNENPLKIVIEFSSPNTNKPLHLGHIRNNLLGVSLSNILTFNNNEVIKVSLLNDRGIHICKTMVAWEKWGNNITPESANKKGDHLIGDFYVKFQTEYDNEIKNLIKTGIPENEATEKSELLCEAKKMLKKWERGNKKVVELWSMLNSWVIDGFNETYQKLGVTFDKIYYESETYLKGKDIILRELSKGNIILENDNSVTIDLTEQGLDKKILLRSDGTSVYITQDIGTAVDRFKELKFDKHFYVVGNEQIYHFKVLREVLKIFGYEWFDKLEHFSYGMVELPEGKMKSREGKVVDADDLIEEMINTADALSQELGKIDKSDQNYNDIIFKIAMGALKYFILKVDPKKNMLFDPKESIDFNGNTGPFIQYTYTRINSIINKAYNENIKFDNQIDYDIMLKDKEIELIKELNEFKNVVNDSAKTLNPALIANYTYNLAKNFNSYYQDTPIIKSDSDEKTKKFRLKLSQNVALVIKTALGLLGIDVPEKM